MKPKDYQTRTLETVRSWLDGLVEMREKAAKLAAVDEDLASTFDFPEAAWKKTVAGSYSKRLTGTGEPLPSACIKIPTGGGKTFLATRIIDLANTIYLRRQHGLVLWIVPSTQIYRQTLAALRDRSHPYRQQLDIASANRTLILEKTRRFRPEDVRESLCVLLLMLPSANRETKETLRMFRDSGGFERFFPQDGDHAAHAEILELVPNLDTFGEGGSGLWKRQIKTSLGNTLRLLRPIVILDEGHKGYSKTALTQLVGRVLRQPYATKTHVPLLDESYVFCFQRRGKELLEEVRKGFGMEGLGDLAARVVSNIDGKPSAGGESTVDARTRLRKRAAEIILPAFMIHDPVDDWRPVHYEADLLTRLPEKEIWKTNERRATRDDAGQFLLSLFEQMPEGDFNGLETKVATFLDRQEQLLYFWHRNASKRGYYVQGWKRHRIYADFIAAGKPVPDVRKGFDRIYVLETKGLHLRNADTGYKQNVFKLCNDRAHGEHWSDFAPAMRNTRVKFEVVFEDEWQSKLTELLAG